MQEIKPYVRAFVQDNFFLGDETDFGDSDSFIENHIIDSTGFLELIEFLEDTFGIKVHDAEMAPENLDTLANIDAYVRRKLAA